MKISKRQLQRIIKEEKRKLSEGMKEMEMELIEDLVDMLIERGAIRLTGPDDDGRKAAYEYLDWAVMPQLKGYGR